MLRIAESAVIMTSRQQLSQSYTRHESLRAWTGGGGGAGGAPRQDRLDLSDEARRLLETGATAGDPLKDDLWANLSAGDRIRLLILSRLLGVDIQVLIGARAAEEAAKAAKASESAAPPAPAPDWGVDYRLDERYAESESLTVSAQGVIRTADGQSIAFAVDLNLSRQFVQESHLRVQAGNARPVDPLVINYDGAAADLTERKFSFDLEVGGKVEQIPFLRQGSGFLALDKNGDGKINNGSELFGPGTGDGFAELANYDADGNHWIDENDPIWDKLQIWTKDADGTDRLFALGQKGVGAIFVGAVDAGFTMTDAANQAKAVNTKAGLFLRENGTAGTVQQLDLMV